MSDKIKWTKVHQALWIVLDSSIKAFRDIKLLTDKEYELITDIIEARISEKCQA